MEDSTITKQINTLAVLRELAIKPRNPRLENELVNSNSSEACYHYSYNILESRFLKGEKIIAKSPKFAWMYAYQILKGRFTAGEKAISSNAISSLFYAKDVLGSRFPLGEPSIIEAGNVYNILNYWASSFKGKVWEDVEHIVLNNKYECTRYISGLKNVSTEDRVRIEKLLVNKPRAAVVYIKYIAKERIPELEPIIISNSGAHKSYLEVLKSFSTDED